MFNAPPPYVPPTLPMSYAAGAPPEALAAGRRAGLLMLVLGGLVLLLGFCNTVQAIIRPAAELLAQQQRLVGEQNAAQLSAEAFKALTVAVGVLTLAAGATLLGLGLGVRRGNRVATWAALIGTILLAGFLGLGTLFILVAGLQSPPLLAMAAVPAIPLALLIWQAVLLIKATRVTGQIAAAQQAYAMQYWQHQQAMAAYGGGYGYGVPQGANPTPQTAPALPPDAPPPAS